RHEGEQHNGVDEPGQDLEAHIAEGALGVRETAPEAEGGPGEGEGGGIGQHMASIGNQCKRARQQTADELGDHEAESQKEADEDHALVALANLGRMAVMPVTMVVMMAIAVIMRAPAFMIVGMVMEMV